MLIIFLFVSIAASVGLYFRSGHILFAIFILLFGLYELPGPILFSGVLGEDFIWAQVIFMDAASIVAVNEYLLALITLFGLLNIVYILSIKMISFRVASWSQTTKYDLPRAFDFMAFVVFVFGLVSVYVGAGAIRILDYVGEALPTTPLFSYGITLLPAVVLTAYYYFRRGNYLRGSFIIFSILPLSHEIFLTSRRQFFAPSVLALILVMLHDKSIKYKYRMMFALATLTLIFFGMQYWLRHEFADNASADSGFAAIVEPQLGEFVAIGSTSFHAWMKFAMSSDTVTYGWHWVFQALNSFPFIKVGDLLFPSYGNELLMVVSQLAPFGGLSIVADALMAFGYFGVVFLGLFLGVSIAFLHAAMTKFLYSGFRMNVIGIYLLTLISMVVLKYRSGLGDIFKNFIALSLLFVFIVFVWSFLLSTQWSRSARTPR